MTFIVMSYALHIPETQWQHRLRKLKGLALIFLIHAQHDRALVVMRACSKNTAILCPCMSLACLA